MSLDKFNQAAEDVKNLKDTPANDELLEIYGLYKQATVGDNTTGNILNLIFKIPVFLL
ncbi:putative acyl-CoA-binding protein [Diaphorina citri]|uniref:Acyl-CoA-binding protein n=1 Tax=Diaphorina citri TaxID=121845 RepID=A0A3Q0JI37_DIACI|nr:putative acyl-CoA-binding protein [Diaphorina citri]